jgi:anthranilate phosphoribosyltransferase
MAERMLAVLEANGVVHAMVVFGHDGLDELTTVTTSTVLETVREAGGDYTRRTFEVDPAALGLELAEAAALVGGSPAENAELAREVLSGSPGPRSDFVVLNAGAALVVAGRAADLAAGIELARSLLTSGAAGAKLEALISVSQAAAAEGLT